MAIQALVHLSESRSPCPLVSFNGGCDDDILQSVFLLHIFEGQSVTSRLETSRYRDFSQFFESIGLGLGLENFGLEKKSRYRSRKYLVSKKSLGIGLENIWSRKKVSVSVSKTLVSKKVSVSVSKILVSKKVSVTT